MDTLANGHGTATRRRRLILPRCDGIPRRVCPKARVGSVAVTSIVLWRR